MPHLNSSRNYFLPEKEVIENDWLGLVYCFFDPGNHRRDFRVCRNRRNSDMVSAGTVFSVPGSFYCVGSLGPKGRKRSITWNPSENTRRDTGVSDSGLCPESN